MECDKEVEELCEFLVLGVGYCTSCNHCRRNKFRYLRCSGIYLYRNDKIFENYYCEVKGFCRCCDKGGFDTDISDDSDS